MRFADWTGWPPGTTLDVGGLPGRVPVGAADVDADGDGRPDTVVVESGDGTLLFTDLDGDLLADQQVRIDAADPAGPGSRADEDPEDDSWSDLLGDLVDAALGR